MDIPIIMKAIRNQPFRILGKSEMAKIPVFGFLYQHAVVMVDRSSAKKRAESVEHLKLFIRKGISVVIAPEGTFNMTNNPLKEFYDGAFRIAIETQTPIKPILFLDTYHRMHYKSIFTLIQIIPISLILIVYIHGHDDEEFPMALLVCFGLDNILYNQSLHCIQLALHNLKLIYLIARLVQ